MRFSGLRVLKEGLTGNKGWTSHWRDPEPKAEYDVGDHRRRRPWFVDGILPGQGPRDDKRCCAGKGLSLAAAT